jgi:hypothetical protein
MMFAQVAPGWWMVLHDEHIVLEWKTLTLLLCIQQYLTLSQAGLVLLQ